MSPHFWYEMYIWTWNLGKEDGKILDFLCEHSHTPKILHQMPNKEHHSIRSVESVLCPQRQKRQQFRHPVAPKKTIDILTEEVSLKGHRGTQVPTSLVFGDILTCQMFEKTQKMASRFCSAMDDQRFVRICPTFFCSHYLEVFPEQNAPQKCINVLVDMLACELEFLAVKPQGSTASASKKQSLPNSHQTQTSHRFKSQESIQPQHCRTWETRRE